MTQAEMFQDCFENVLFSTEYFAQDITYAGTSVKAILEPKEDTNEETGHVENLMVLYLMPSEVRRPNYLDAATVRMPNNQSKSWYVHEILEGNIYYWKLLCKEEEKPKL